MKPFAERNPVIIAVIGLVLLIGLSWAAYSADDLPVVSGGTTYSADFSEAAGLKTNDPVRVAGVKVGKVTGVSLDGAKVKVSFRVNDAWIGESTRASIMIETLLGDKYLAVEPLGNAEQRPSRRIPLSRTTSPYDVTEAFKGLGQTLEQLDTATVAESLRTLSQTFRNTAPHVRKSLEGLSALSVTISSRDRQLQRLLSGTRQISGTLADQNAAFEALLRDGNLLLAELQNRRDAIHRLLISSRQLGQLLIDLVRGTDDIILPTLRALDQLTTMLQRNESSLDRVLAVASPYYRLVTSAVGNGQWFDSYLCGLTPREYLPPNTPPATGCMPPKQGGR